MKKMVFLLSFFVLSVAVFYWALFSGDLPEEDDEDTSEWLVLSDEQLKDGDIAFAEVQSHTVEQSLPIYGKITLIPDKHCHITCKTSGIVIKAFKNLGDQVHQGEPLALVESKELAEVQAQFQITDSKIGLFQSMFEKEVKLTQKNLGTDHELVQALAILQQAEIEKRILEDKLHAFGITSNKPPIYEVKSPFNGTVIKRLVTLGQTVVLGEELYEVANLDNVWGEFAIYPQDAHLLGVNKEIIIHDGHGSNAKGVISYISPMIDEDNGTIAFVANIDNSEGKWRPGSNIHGKLIAATLDMTNCVPSEAVVIINGIPHIFVYHDEGIEPRKVYLGFGDEKFTEIVAGAFDGEKVVSVNASLLKCEMTKQEPD